MCEYQICGLACPSVALCGCRRLLFFRFVGLAALAQFGLLALLAARGAFGHGDDINDDFAVVLAALRACAVREPRGAAFALRETLARNSMVAAPHCGLGTVPAHPDYHSCDNIRDLWTLGKGTSIGCGKQFEKLPAASFQLTGGCGNRT